MNPIYDNSVSILVLGDKSKTVKEQYVNAVNNIASDWILITDNDAKILSYPYTFQFDAEFISFKWIDAPALFQRNHFGIGLYKVSKLKEIFCQYPDLPSEGLDLILRDLMITIDSNEYCYTHNTHLTVRKMFRYGKGRSFYMRTCKNKTPISLETIKLMTAYFSGVIYGMIIKVKDKRW